MKLRPDIFLRYPSFNDMIDACIFPKPFKDTLNILEIFKQKPFKNELIFFKKGTIKLGGLIKI